MLPKISPHVEKRWPPNTDGCDRPPHYPPALLRVKAAFPPRTMQFRQREELGTVATDTLYHGRALQTALGPPDCLQGQPEVPRPGVTGLADLKHEGHSGTFTPPPGLVLLLVASVDLTCSSLPFRPLINADLPGRYRPRDSPACLHWAEGALRAQTTGHRSTEPGPGLCVQGAPQQERAPCESACWRSRSLFQPLWCEQRHMWPVDW